MAYPFRTSIDAASLEKRFPAALWLTRTLLPELGVNTVSFGSTSTKNPIASTASDADLDHATFKPIKSLDEALVWLDDTACVVRNAQSFQELCKTTSNQRIEPAGKHSRAYLVLDPKEGPSALVMNISHVLNGHRMLFQVQTLLQCLLHQSFDSASALGQVELVRSIFQPEQLEHVLPRLPQSLPHAYKTRFQPNQEQYEAAARQLAEQMENAVKPTVAIASAASLPLDAQRPMVNLRRSFTLDRSRKDSGSCASATKLPSLRLSMLP